MRRQVSNVNLLYQVLDDPDELFVSGSFPKFDFLCSLEGKVWAEGMVVKDPEGSKLRVSYPMIEGQEYCVLVNTSTGTRWVLVKKNKTLVEMERTPNAKQT